MSDDTVQGLGGAFLYVDDLDGAAAWYRQHLGLELQSWGDSRGTVLPSMDRQPAGRMASTTFALFQAEKPLPEGVRTGRVNFRVRDLDGLVARLQDAGVRTEALEDESFGRFVWAWDPEGNKVELWEPPPAE